MRVLDTNILIYYSEGDRFVNEKLERWRASGPLLISTIVEAELLSGSQLTLPKIEALTQALQSFTIVPVDSIIAQTAASFRRTHRMKLFDALVAATAWQYQAPLVTRNVRDFAKIKEITVEKL